MRREHHFSSEDGITVMRDVFAFESPLGWLGKAADVVLKPYLRRFLAERAAVVKHFAETEEWRRVVPARASA
jgi:ligand-binding SRPBCC domain-containing protein